MAMCICMRKHKKKHVRVRHGCLHAYFVARPCVKMRVRVHVSMTLMIRSLRLTSFAVGEAMSYALLVSSFPKAFA